MTGANCKSFGTQAQWGAAGHPHPFWKARCHQPSPTVSAAPWLIAPAPPSSALPGHSPAGLPAPVGTRACSPTHRSRAPGSTVTFLPCAPSGTSDLTQNCAPAACLANFLRSCSFPFRKTVPPTGTLSKGLAQILAPLSRHQIHAAPAPGANSARWLRGPSGPPRPLPPAAPAALTDLRQAQLQEAQSPG